MPAARPAITVHVRVPAKPKRRSRTLWFNAVVGLLAALLPLALQYLPELQEQLSPEVYAWALFTVALANGALRFVTHAPLAGFAPPVAPPVAPPGASPGAEEFAPTQPGVHR